MILLAFVGIIVLGVVGSVFNGYVLSILWGWFMVPTFHLPTLSVAPAIGIAMVIGYLTKQESPDVEEKERSTGMKVARFVAQIIMKPLVALAFGWVVHLFM